MPHFVEQRFGHKPKVDDPGLTTGPSWSRKLRIWVRATAANLRPSSAPKEARNVRPKSPATNLGTEHDAEGEARGRDSLLPA